MHRLLGWSDETEDIVQDVFLAAWQNLKRFRGDASVQTWLTRIAINRCRSFQRRKKLWGRWWSNVSTETRPLTDTTTAQQVAIEREATDAMRDGIRQLPPSLREVTVLCYLESLQPAEISELLNLRLNTVEVRLHRARQRLKASLNGQLENEPQ